MFEIIVLPIKIDAPASCWFCVVIVLIIWYYIYCCFVCMLCNCNSVSRLSILFLMLLLFMCMFIDYYVFGKSWHVLFYVVNYTACVHFWVVAIVCFKFVMFDWSMHSLLLLQFLRVPSLYLKYTYSYSWFTHTNLRLH